VPQRFFSPASSQDHGLPFFDHNPLRNICIYKNTSESWRHPNPPHAHKKKTEKVLDAMHGSYIVPSDRVHAHSKPLATALRHGGRGGVGGGVGIQCIMVVDVRRGKTIKEERR
jgi:hypothetical protein